MQRVHLVPTEQNASKYATEIQSLPTRDFVASIEIELREKPGHVLTVLHGIRDKGIWGLDLRHYTQQAGIKIEIIPVSYGWMGILAFLSRHRAKKVEEKVLGEFKAILQTHPHATHSIMAHSNGTKIAASAIKALPSRYAYAIFCGSVCPREEAPALHVLERCINDCSPIDIWPLVAEAINPFSYEATGVHGFRKLNVNDRFYTRSHGGCLTRKHFEENIIPVLLKHRQPIGDKPSSVWPIRTPYFIRVFLFLLLLSMVVFLGWL